jgi:hypothetical protein
MSAVGGVSMKSLARLLALSVWLAGASAASQPLSSSQQGCVLELNKRGAAVVKVQGKEELRCLKNAARGKEANAQACVTGDARSKVGKTLDKLTAGAALVTGSGQVALFVASMVAGMALHHFAVENRTAADG